MSFPRVLLGELVRPVERLEKPVAGRSYRQIGVRLWGLGAYEREVLDGHDTKYSKLNRAIHNDIIVNKIWARNGSVAIVPESLTGSFCSGEFPLYSPNQELLEPQWFHWITKAKWFWNECDEMSRGTSGKNRIRPERFLEIAIPLPPIDEQRRILQCIENMSTKLWAARQLKRQAVKLAASLSSAISDGAYESLEKEYGTEQVGSLCISISDGDHNTPQFSEVGVKFVFVGNVSSGYLHFEGSRFVTRDYFMAIKPQRVPRRGDILYSAVGATLGVPAIVDTDEQFCFQRHVAIIKPEPSLIDSRYCWHMLRSRTVSESAWSKTTGTAQPTIPLRGIGTLEIPVPPLAEQRSIALSLDELNAKADKLKKLQAKTATELDALMPSILDRAFTGEL